MTARILYHHRTRADDGQAVHVRELLGALRGLGHEVVEVALVHHGDPMERGRNGRTAAPPAPRRAGLWQRLVLPRSAQEILEHLYTHVGRRMLMRAARGFAPDLIYERYAMSCGAGVAAARALRIPCFLEVNAPMCLEMERLGLVRFKNLARKAERRILGAATRVFTVTGVLRDHLVALGVDPARIVVTPNGAEIERFIGCREDAADWRQRLGLGGRTVIGFVGFPRPWHRLDLLLAAVARLKAEGHGDLAVVLVGDGPARADVAAQAAALGLSEAVRFTGTLPPGDVPGAVATFDVAVIPAINEYASPLKLFDSLAAGVATVAPDQPNLREIVRDGVDVLLFRPGDGMALAAAMRRLVADPVLRARLGDTGRRTLHATDRTWRNNARRVIEELERVRSGA